MGLVRANIIFYAATVFFKSQPKIGYKSSEKGRFPRVFGLKELYNIAGNNIMQRLYKNENLLFKGFQDFISQKQHMPENCPPSYLRWFFFESVFDVSAVDAGRSPVRGCLFHPLTTYPIFLSAALNAVSFSEGTTR